MKNLSLLMILIFFALTACSTQTTKIVRIPEPMEEIKPPVKAEQTPGSLWTNDSTSIFADHKARKVGDIINVTISEQSSASKVATTTTGRTSSFNAGISNLFGLENYSKLKNSNVDLTNLVNTNFTNSFDGNGKTTSTGDFTAKLAAQVVGVYPNGNLKIRGGKEVTLNGEVQIIYLTGIVRPADITAANTIESSQILNAKITYTGRGVISDKQQPGWLTRTLDNIWPF
jgi:flagellar L-ring protein precursor FlgH